MKTIKGVILEQKGSKCIIMGSDGSFREIVNKTKAQVGEEIEIALNPGLNLNRFSRLRVWAGVAALFLLVFTATLGWNLWQASTAVALVSVDINPSLELTVNARNKVLKVTAMNEDAETILKGDSLKGQTVTEAMQKIVNKAIEYKFLSNDQAWIVVGLSPEGKASLQKSSELASPQIIKTVKKATQDKGLDPQVAVLTLSDQDRKNAERQGLTVGQYVLWQNANKAGLEIKPEGVKDKESRQLILDDPQVQEQLQNEKNVVQAHPMSQEMKDKLSRREKENLSPERKADQDQTKDKDIEDKDFTHGKMEQELRDKGQGMAKKTGIEQSNNEKKEDQEDSDKQSSSNHSNQVWRNSSDEQTEMMVKTHNDEDTIKGNEENNHRENEKDQSNQDD